MLRTGSRHQLPSRLVGLVRPAFGSASHLQQTHASTELGEERLRCCAGLEALPANGNPTSVMKRAFHSTAASFTGSSSSSDDKSVVANKTSAAASESAGEELFETLSHTNPDLDGVKSQVFDVLLRNRAWAAKERKKENFFQPLSAGQKPKYLCICCSDSRCPTEMMMGFRPGEAFVVRNVANCVMNGDLGINAATQYAVDVLGVQSILVIGHRDCGGVKAAMTRQSFGTTIDAYVRHVRDVYRTHIEEIDAIEDPQARLNKLIDLHVTEQCINLFKMGFVQRARRKTRPDGGGHSTMLPQIHGLVYDPSTGLLNEIDIKLREKARHYGKVYDVLS